MFLVQVPLHELGHLVAAAALGPGGVKGVVFDPGAMLSGVLSGEPGVASWARVEFRGSVFELYGERGGAAVALAGLAVDAALLASLFLVAARLRLRDGVSPRFAAAFGGFLPGGVNAVYAWGGDLSMVATHLYGSGAAETVLTWCLGVSLSLYCAGAAVLVTAPLLLDVSRQDLSR